MGGSTSSSGASGTAGAITGVPNTQQQTADQQAILSLIQAQQAQGTAAQQQEWNDQIAAIRTAQRAAAVQQGQQGKTDAMSQLQQQNAVDQATSSDAQSKQTAAANAAAIASAGGQFDPNAQKANALANLGLVAGGLPSTPANEAGSGAPAPNPAANTAAQINQKTSAPVAFQMPSMNGITFGGKR